MEIVQIGFVLGLVLNRRMRVSPPFEKGSLFRKLGDRKATELKV